MFLSKFYRNNYYYVGIIIVTLDTSICWSIRWVFISHIILMVQAGYSREQFCFSLLSQSRMSGQWFRRAPMCMPTRDNQETWLTKSPSFSSNSTCFTTGIMVQWIRSAGCDTTVQYIWCLLYNEYNSTMTHVS